jgi:hypothetical protein
MLVPALVPIPGIFTTGIGTSTVLFFYQKLRSQTHHQANVSEMVATQKPSTFVCEVSESRMNIEADEP